MLFDDDELSPDLLTDDVRANFFTLMKLVAERWNDQFAADFVGDEGDPQR